MKIRSFFLFALTLSSLIGAEQNILRSIEELNRFFEAVKPQKIPFNLTGVVISTSHLPETDEIILSDENDRRMQFFRDGKLPQPEPGETINVCGFASISRDNEPYLSVSDFKVLKKGTHPKPFPVKLSETNARRHHLQTITTQGTVIDAFPDEIDRRFHILLLKDKNVVVPVSLQNDIFGECGNLIDASIEVTGIYRSSVGGARKFSWPNITPQKRDDIKVTTAPPKDVFSAPPIEKRLYLTSEEISRMSKRSVSGEVLATWSRDRAMVQTFDGRIVNLKLAHALTLPACGKYILAVGQPETDFFHINLSAARWKEIPEPAGGVRDVKNEGLETVFWSKNGCISINGESYGKLISAEGIVRTLPSPDDSNVRFVLESSNLSMSVDATSNPAAVDRLQIGSKIRVTGRCILLTDAEANSYRSAKISGIALVIRTPGDIAILSRPSWWTLKRLTAVISLLVAVLIGIYVWNRILQNLVNRRGRELYREQVAHAIAEFKTDERTRLAVELHDSLSQTLAGVACHIAVGTEKLNESPSAAKPYLATARKMLNSCRTELRQCLFDLRSDTLEESDFSTAIRKTLNQLDADAEISIRFNIPRQLLKDTTAHAILSIIRELTSNAIRHGNAGAVKIAGCIENGTLLFSVKDNGCGFDPSECNGPAQGHFGLEGIRNRLEKLGGTLVIDSAPGAGTKISASIPVPSRINQESAPT